MAAAIIWFVGTRTAKPSSAGCALVHGNPTAQPGENEFLREEMTGTMLEYTSSRSFLDM